MPPSLGSAHSVLRISQTADSVATLPFMKTILRNDYKEAQLEGVQLLTLAYAYPFQLWQFTYQDIEVILWVNLF